MLSQLTAVRPAEQLLVGVSSLIGFVEAFADQIWTPARQPKFSYVRIEPTQLVLKIESSLSLSLSLSL